MDEAGSLFLFELTMHVVSVGVHTAERQECGTHLHTAWLAVQGRGYSITPFAVSTLNTT